MIKANEDLFRQKIEENHRKIQELQQQMEGYSAESIEANIARQQQRLESQRKVLSERAIQKYRNDMQSRLATLEQEKRKLTAQNALYAQALGNAQLL